jgi:NCAIR mutase (PurE)-related protein
MDRDSLKRLLGDVAEGKTGIDEAFERLRKLPFEDTGYARIDHHRELRRGFPEVIFCEGKTAGQIEGISKKIIEHGTDLLATRCSPEQFAAVKGSLKGAVYHEDARLFAVKQSEPEEKGFVAVVAGGTSDRPVSEEAALTAHYFGCRVERFYDVGVAGIHRLFSSWEEISKADVIIVVAGMEGALASVVAGMAEAPVIAVPTSIGYGASFGGLAALLAMLNSCAGGVTVVNIDNGFGAAYAAAVICRKMYQGEQG